MRPVDLTHGPVARGVAAFALPLLGSSVVQQLYGTVDFLFVGNVLGTAATAALGVGAMMLALMVGLFSGVALGVIVKVANLAGARDADGAASAAATGVWLGIAGGLLLALTGEALAEPFVAWMAVPAEAAAEAVAYLRFAVAAAVPLALYNACAGALRGFGDSRAPLLAQVAGGVLNIGANWLALCVLGLGVAGCGAATFAANGAAAAVALGSLARRGGMSGRGAWPDLGIARSVLAFGLPVSAQTVAITLSNVVMQHQIDLLGVEAIAAFAIYLNVELPIYYPILAMGQATTTFVAQNAGAGDHARCKAGVRTCQLMCLAVAAAMSAVMLACGQWAYQLFDRSDAVIGIGCRIIGITFPFYFLYAVLEVQGDAMRGYGHSLAPALVVLANICALRVALVVGVATDVAGIAAAYPVTWATTAAIMAACRRWMAARGGR